MSTSPVSIARRACLLAGLALLGGTARAARSKASKAPPAVNLQVQWRWVESDGSDEADEVPQWTGMRVGTAGLADPRAAAGWQVRTSAAAGPGLMQQLWLRNGGRARLLLSESQPVPWLELATLPQGKVAALRYRWIQRVSALSLRATWPGGARSVEVELQAETREGALGSPARRQMSTQVLAPRGQWVTVARSASALPAAGKPGQTLRSTDAQRRLVQRELQIRVDRLT